MWDKSSKAPEPADLPVLRPTHFGLAITLHQLRTMAHHCLQTAQQVTAQGHLARLVELAQKWLDMADKAEERDYRKAKD